MFEELTQQLLDLRASMRGPVPAAFAMVISCCSCCCCAGQGSGEQ
jgi:hypothetical protein